MSGARGRGARVLLLANNWVGWQVAHALRERGEEIVGLVLHPPQRRTWGAEIIAAAGVAPSRIFDGSRLRDPETARRLRALGAEVAVSALFGYVLHPELLSAFDKGAVNIHPGLLPYGRGAHPNVWSIVERTPAGVTVHYMDEGVDTGDIIAQREVAVEPSDTAERLYRKLERAAVALFAEQWPAIRDGAAPRAPQPRNGGSTHRARDLARLDEIDLDRTYTGRELIDLLRARTFPPFPGAFFRDGGRTVHVRIELLDAEQAGDAVAAPPAAGADERRISEEER